MRKRTIEKTIASKIDKAISLYNMIEEGDKIAVAISGGKDSLCMLYNLFLKQRYYNPSFEILPIHITMDFSPGKSRTEDVVKKSLDRWDIPLSIVHVPVLKRLKPGKKMNCYWCSTQRRMELIQFAEKNNCTKIALGHHQDDIIETLLMNMSFKGEISTMLPKLKYDNYPYTVIRPLALVREKEVIEFSDKLDIERASRTCIYDSQSRRQFARNAIAELEKGCPQAGDLLFKSMSNIATRYLL